MGRGGSERGRPVRGGGPYRSGGWDRHPAQARLSPSRAGSVQAGTRRPCSLHRSVPGAQAAAFLDPDGNYGRRRLRRPCPRQAQLQLLSTPGRCACGGDTRPAVSPEREREGKKKKRKGNSTPSAAPTPIQSCAPHAIGVRFAGFFLVLFDALRFFTRPVGPAAPQGSSSFSSTKPRAGLIVN